MVRVSPLISRCIAPPYLLPFICDGGARVSFLSHIINGPAAYLIALPSLRQHYSAGLDRDVYTQRSCTQRAGVSPLHGGRRRRRRRPPPDVDGTCLGPRKTMAGRPSVDPLVRFPEKPPCRAPCSARNPLPPSCSPTLGLLSSTSTPLRAQPSAYARKLLVCLMASLTCSEKQTSRNRDRKEIGTEASVMGSDCTRVLQSARSAGDDREF